MPVMAFLRGDRDKDKDKEQERDRDRDKEDATLPVTSGPTSPPAAAAVVTSSAPLPSPSLQAPSNTQASSAAVGASGSANSNGHANAAASSSSTAGQSTDSPTSKYHPSRLLRRKASVKAAANKDASAEFPSVEHDPLPSSSGSGSRTSVDSPAHSRSQSYTKQGPLSPRPLPSSPRRTPSSPQGLPSSPRTLLGFDRDSSATDRGTERYHSYSRTGNGSETRHGSMGGGANGGVYSPTQSKRSAFVYDGRLMTDGAMGDEPVVIIPGSRPESIQDEPVASLAALGIRSDTPASTSSLPKVVDGGIGIGSSSSMGVFGRITGAAGRPWDQESTYESSFFYSGGHPPTPPDSANSIASAPGSTGPFYPTALSPPRRPMPKSPRAKANAGAGAREHRSGSPASVPANTAGSSSPASAGMLHAISAVGGPPAPMAPGSGAAELKAARPSSASPVRGGAKDTPVTDSNGRPSITAEWLARKPSGRMRHRPSLSTEQAGGSPPVIPHPHRSSPSVGSMPSRDSSLGNGNGGSRTFIPPRQGSLDDSPRIETAQAFAARPRNTSFSSVNSDTDPASSDGEVGLARVSIRQSLLSTPSRGPPGGSRRSPAPGGGGYEVHVVCHDERDGQDRDEIKWEVTIKRRNPHSTLTAPTSPLQLSTAGNVVQAPQAASSINLSLALDQPTGKLVFISFPMDIHATPTRRRRPSTNTTRTSFSGPSGNVSSPRPSSGHDTAMPVRPSTPPMQTSYTLSPVFNNDTPTRTPSLSRRKAPPPWPSPKAKMSEQPPRTPESPKDMFTPRRSRVTPSKLDGDLLHKVTMGESEELLPERERERV
ncbi:hypothetical protein IAU60_001247 [Kwoniella sp. DSM 27419]